MRLKVDTEGTSFLVAIAPEPVMDFTTKAAKTDENNVPLYAVQLVALADGGAEVITVKVAGDPGKGITQGVTVRVVGLVATPWQMGDRAGIAFRAERIEPVNGSTTRVA